MQQNSKPLCLELLLLKILALIFLRGLDLTSQRFLIDICVIIDVLTTYLIITSIYPLMTTVTKSNRIYSKRKLVEYFGRDLGVLVGGIMIGQHAWMVLQIIMLLYSFRLFF